MISLLRMPLFQSLLTFSLLVSSIITMAFIFSPVLLAMFVSCTLYAVLEPVNNQMTGRGLSPSFSATIILCGLIVLSSLLILIAFPKLLDTLVTAQDTVNLLKQMLHQWADKMQFLAEQAGIEVDRHSIQQYLDGGSTTLNLDVIIKGSNLVMDISGTLLLVPFVVFFLLRDYKSSRNKLLALLPNAYFEMGWAIYYRVAKQLQGYIKGVMIQTSILATIATTGFYIAGFESAVMLGLLAGVFGIIPYLGPILALFPPLLMAVGMQPFDVYYVWAAVIVVGIAFIFDNLVVIPTIIANAVDLHPFIVIVGVIIFGSLFGIVGTILGLPIMASAKILFLGLYQGFDQRAKSTR